MPTQGYITEIGAEWEGTTPSSQLQLPIAAAKLRDKANIDGIGFDGSAGIIHYATCTQAANVAAKSASVVDANGNALPFSLVKGSVVYVKFSNSNTAANPTLNVNNTGAKSIKRYSTTAPSNTASTSWNAGSVVCLVYDGTYWQMANWLNSTYANYSLGQGYGTCATPEFTTAKIVTLSNYSLSTGGIVAVKFTNAVPANSTMDINSRGSKSIYHRGAPITSGIINAGDTATFIYSTYYHLISLDHVGEYELPIATDTVLGGVKVGAGLSISSGGVLSANGGGVADAVAWGNITGTLADQTDLGTALGLKANTADLSAVAFSNDYEDLDNKPDIPTSTSELDNDSGFLTIADLPQPADSNPLMDGTVSIGSSTDYAREDHRHPTDTSRAADTAVVHKEEAEVITGEKTTTADLILRNTTGSSGLSSATPNLVFQRGLDTDSYIDWLIGVNSSGRLVFSSRSSGTKTVRMQLIGGSSLQQLLSSIDIKAPKLITDGGTAQQYVKGDGTLGGNATQSVAGLLSAADKTKLDGLENYDVFTTGDESTPNTAGIDGLVPAPSYNNRLKYLRGDGTWESPEFENTVTLNGRTDTVQLFGRALFAYSVHTQATTRLMSPICTSGGTGNKTPNYDRMFPIGCAIYYNPSISQYAANTDIVGQSFYTIYDSVDARYTAVTGTSVNLSNSSSSEVYLRVKVEDEYWSPYYESGSTSEIIVTSNNFVANNFYIYLGKTSSSNNYTFQLEDNHPLYYYENGVLIDWASYKSRGTSSGWHHVMNHQQDTVLDSTHNPFNVWTTFSSNDMPPSGLYVIHGEALFKNPNIKPIQVHVMLRYANENLSTLNVVAATSVTLNYAIESSSGDTYGGTLVTLQGLVNLPIAPSIVFGYGMNIEVEASGNPVTLVAGAPLSGSNIGALAQGATKIMMYKIG